MKKYSAHEFATLLVVVLAIISTAGGGGAVAVVGSNRVQETTSSGPGPYCNNNHASDDYEAHKAHVLDELANVTPTTQGYSYATTFPDPAGGDVVHGEAVCTRGVGVSECVGCLIGAKLSLAQTCAFYLSGVVKLSLCGMSFVPVVAAG
ncbi:unnamed protein product [Linum tenue]|uniref:Gnk2-homologous domain-containing protein n=1 Tax=Linum tenue TaxID=586396 RepID=A0AAV0GVD5_9ROSI|nr:unnamed protein product [Linum tenue]